MSERQETTSYFSESDLVSNLLSISKCILTLSLLNKLSSAWIAVCFSLNFYQLTSNLLQIWKTYWLSGKQLGTWPDAELLGVWSGSKLFANAWQSWSAGKGLNTDNMNPVYLTWSSYAFVPCLISSQWIILAQPFSKSSVIYPMCPTTWPDPLPLDAFDAI